MPITSIQLIQRLQHTLKEHGPLPVFHGTTVGRDLSQANVDYVTIMIAGNNSPWGMKSGERYILLEMAR